MILVGDHYESMYKLGTEEISSFARLVGDMNPIHHDPDFAANSRIGCIIVSGPQLAGLMMATSGTQLSKNSFMLGLSFDIKFKQVVKCDEEFLLRWQVIETQKKSSGTLVDTRITIHVKEELCVVAKTRDLVFQS